MVLTEKLMRGLAEEVMGTPVITYGTHDIDFGKPFRRLPMSEAVVEYTDLTAQDLQNKEAMINLLSKKDLGLKKDELQAMSLTKLMVLCFEEFVEDKLIQPTFITHYPTEISPLSRRNEENPDIVDRFELFINGWEIANAFNELNDPTDQLDRFADQAMAKEAGDDEACDPDYDYVRALEYGMPPTAGQGIGIDRLVMVLTNSTTIKDVLLFPLLKKEVFFNDSED
jgi:lysyl-tRNA synthetase, class II